MSGRSLLLALALGFAALALGPLTTPAAAMHRCEDVDCVPFQAANAVACLAEATVEGLFPFLDLPLCGAIN